MQIMAPPFLLSVALITVCCLVFVKPEPLALRDEAIAFDVRRVVLYGALFTLAIAIVFRGVPYWIGLAVIPAVLLFADPKALKSVDYPLLLTFVFFFIFAGNMARIGAVRQFFSLFLDRNTLLFSALSCQCISNVPSAILLSHFTVIWRELLLGVNIGGLGTPVASLASLISFKLYSHAEHARPGAFMRCFLAVNLGLLAVLLALVRWIS